MPRGTKKKEVVESSEEVTKTPKVTKQSVDDAILKEYAHLFEEIPDRKLDLFKTNIPGLDFILGGGLPRGQMVHIYGPEGSGKSTTVLHIHAAVQKQGGKSLLIDTENSVDRGLAANLGINLEDKTQYMRKAPSGEYVFDMIEKFVRANLYNVIIVDTVAALASAKILASSNEDDNIGIKARMLSKALEKLNNACVYSGTIVIFVNQLRANISPMPGARQFNTSGGKALPFYANINILMNKVGPVKDGEDIIGQLVKIKVEKNKIAPPMRDVTCNLVYGDGFRRDMDLILSAKDAGIVQMGGGGYYKYKGETLGQGLHAVVEHVKLHPELLNELEALLYGTHEEAVAIVGPKEEIVPRGDNS